MSDYISGQMREYNVTKTVATPANNNLLEDVSFESLNACSKYHHGKAIVFSCLCTLRDDASLGKNSLKALGQKKLHTAIPQRYA